MASREEHLSKWRHNETRSLQLEPGPFTDWSVTTMFYAALHLVDAYFVSQSPPVQTAGHQRRNALVQRDPSLGSHYADYQELYDRSRDARYDCLSFSTADVRSIRQQTFEPFTQHVRRLLGV
jgi:hypothetical protein